MKRKSVLLRQIEKSGGGNLVYSGFRKVGGIYRAVAWLEEQCYKFVWGKFNVEHVTVLDFK